MNEQPAPYSATSSAESGPQNERGPSGALSTKTDPRPMNARRVVLTLSAALAATNVHAQAFMAVTVSARVVARCTATMLHPQSTCSQQTLLQQISLKGASAKISTSGSDVLVTQIGGRPPKIELNGRRATITF